MPLLSTITAFCYALHTRVISSPSSCFLTITTVTLFPQKALAIPVHEYPPTYMVSIYGLTELVCLVTRRVCTNIIYVKARQEEQVEI